MDTNPDTKINENATNDKLKKEESFLQNLKKLEQLDSLITNFIDHFNQGLTDLAYLRFKNENLGYSLNAGSYSETPAKRVLRESNNLFFIEINNENKWNLEEIEEEEDFDENSQFLKKFKDENDTELKKIDINEQILTKFGIQNRDPLVYHSQNEFIKALEKIIELRNFLETSGVYK